MTQPTASRGMGDRHQGLSRWIRDACFLAFLALFFYSALALGSYDANDPAWSRTGDGYLRNLMGYSGALFADISFTLLGYTGWLLPAWASWGAVRVLLRQPIVPGEPLGPGVRALGLVLILLSSCTLLALKGSLDTLPMNAGGMLGQWLGDWLSQTLNVVGARILLTLALLLGLTLFLDLSWLHLMEQLGQRTLAALEQALHQWRRWRDAKQEREEAQQRMEQRHAALAVHKAKEAQRKPIVIEPAVVKAPLEQAPREIKERQQSLPGVLPVDGQLPALALLEPPEIDQAPGFSEESLAALSRLLELKLQDFGVEVQVEAVLPGPVITRFEIQPAAGVKASKISNLARDLARSLSVSSVRVVEVIPGKPVMGIEIPNENRQMVRLREILASEAYERAKSPLTMALGSDISGEPVVADLAKMPHLLVAGTTGSGKSVGVNAMLVSLLYKSGPDEVRLVLVDPKMLELSVYEGIPHLLTPVITDMKDAFNGLRWCVGEMERRYQLMSKVGVRNLAGFNQKVRDAKAAGEPLLDPLWNPDEQYAPGHDVAPAPELETLPAIVVVVDEFADMIMIVGKKVEEQIARIAQKARAAGIHLILATQRPSVDVITGLIKANIPTRIAFQVSSKIDSRTILDQGGAEQLLGHGDMLYMPPGTGLPTRVHGAFVSDDEVHRVVSDWKARGAPNYIEGLLDEGASLPEPGAGGGDGGEGSEEDPLYDEAVAFVIETRRASASAIQRKFRIGYNRASRLIEAMEMAGVVTDMGSNGSREVLVPSRG